MSEESRAVILIVDDSPVNLKMLGEVLEEQHYEVRAAPGGRFALRALAQFVPDLILLDIKMPGLNGYETCERLKADERIMNVPVIFLSALADTGDKIKAFEAGGVDYITKPFQPKEVLARVETHLRISRLQRELEERYHQLKELEAQRDSLTHMIVHDLRSPLFAITSILELLAMDSDRLGEKRAKHIQGALRSGEALMQMISALLDISKMESGQMTLDLEKRDLVATAREALRILSGLAEAKSVSFEGEDGGVLVVHDLHLTERIITNLVGNALRFSPGEGTVTVTVNALDDRARVEVRDKGPGIPEAYHEKIFEKFGQVEARMQGTFASTGLGLAFCRLAVEAHGGEIGVVSEVGKGSTFWFELPLAPQDSGSSLTNSRIAS